MLTAHRFTSATAVPHMASWQSYALKNSNRLVQGGGGGSDGNIVVHVKTSHSSGRLAAIVTGCGQGQVSPGADHRSAALYRHLSWSMADRLQQTGYGVAVAALNTEISYKT